MASFFGDLFQSSSVEQLEFQDIYEYLTAERMTAMRSAPEQNYVLKEKGSMEWSNDENCGDENWGGQ